MANLFTDRLKIIGFVSVAVLICLYIYHRLVTARHWSRINVPHAKPIFLVGNLWKSNLLENFTEILARIHLENKEKKIFGIWSFNIPILVVSDLEIVKRILISDFNDFRDRGIELDEDLDPIGNHLFVLSGKRWRNLRVKLTPTFTSGKMKMMFPTMLKCGEELRRHLKTPSERQEIIETKDLLSRFTTDVIGSCAFGLEMNTLQNPKSEFREYGKRILNPSFVQFLLNIIIFVCPTISRLFKIRFVPKDVSDFFIKIVDDTIKYREETQTVRDDFLQLLIQLMRAGKIEDVDKTPVDRLEDEEIVRKFSLNEAAAQCFVFFAAGFETSPTTIMFALYELALNPDIQARLQSEIDAILESSDGALTYENVMGLEYLDMVVYETLRKYPPFGNLQRQSAKDYRIPELDVTLPKGTRIFISATGIHRDPDIYPDPDKFDPERFTSVEKSRRDTCAFLSFGEGPRNCIGTRFALMQVKIGLTSILRDYSVEVAKTTPIPVVYDIKSFVLAVKGGMNLVFSKR